MALRTHSPPLARHALRGKHTNEPRPLVASPPNRRRSSAGRRRPKVRDGSRNGTRGSVVLRLDHDNDDDGDAGGSGSRHGVIAAAEIEELGAVSADQRIRPTRVGDACGPGGGGGGSGRGGAERQHEGSLEERSKKRPLAAGGSRKRGRTTPPPPSSWLALRRALHERYRDSEEHRAAEQTEAEAAEKGRRGWGGSGPNGGRGGWGGEVMSPGLR